jgi:hypothetical protein
LDGPPNDWPEAPTLVESIWQYRWLVAVAVLVGGLVAFAWSSSQPVRYQGEVRVFLDIGGDQSVDADRIVRSQAEYLTSPKVLDRAVALYGGRLTREELRERLTVEPATDADVITVRVLEATPQGAATLADTVVRAYREVVAEQTNDAATQEAAALAQRQQQLEREIVTLDEQLRAEPGNPRLQANRDAKSRQLVELADQSEASRRDAARASRTAETLQEQAPIPDEPTQPKPLRTTAIGAMLALVAAAALAWWLNGRGMTFGLQWPSLPMLRSGAEEGDASGREAPFQLTARRPDGRTIPTNGSPSGNGSASGIADFDEIATSVQQLFRFLDGPPRLLYDEDLPQWAAEEIAQLFQVDLAVVLLRNGDEVWTMGSVGLDTEVGAADQDLRDLIEEAARSGSRLLGRDELRRLVGTGLASEQAGPLALVPLVRDNVGFGVLLAGRWSTDEQGGGLSGHEVEEITSRIQDMIPHLWAWLLLQRLRVHLGVTQ